MNLNLELLKLYRCKQLNDLLAQAGGLFTKAGFEHVSLDWRPAPGPVQAMRENLSPVWDNFEDSLGDDAERLRSDLVQIWETALEADPTSIRNFLAWQIAQDDVYSAAAFETPICSELLGAISNYQNPPWVDCLSQAVSSERDRVLLLTARTRQPICPQRNETASLIFDTFVAAYRYLRSQSPTIGTAPDQVALNSALSSREIECLQWLAVGKTISEAACILGISERTLRFHVTNARDRLGVSTTMQAVVAAALRYGFDPSDPRRSIYTACRGPLNLFA
ncbi:MAG: helix-turn-helix transcriptional regulator [Henriciella sp.]